MDKALYITQEIKDKNPSFRRYGLGLSIFTTLPSRFNGIENIGGYYETHTDKHEADGFWDVEKLPLQQYQRHGALERKGTEKLYHYPIIDFTQEEVAEAQEIEQNAPLNEEYQKYLQRQKDGVNAYMMISAEFRLAKLSGVISEAEHGAIEELLTPVRNEVIAGQWIKGKQLLVELGSEVIGIDLYNKIFNQLDEYIIQNY